MATSGTITFQEQRDEIISDALTRVGAIGPGRPPTGPQKTHASRALNRVVKSVDPQGLKLWKVVRRTFTTTQGTATYTPANDVMSFDEPMTYMVSGQTSRSIITQMSRDDYMRISDRTQQGTPTLYFEEQALNSSGLNQLTVTFWPVPPATGDTIEYAALTRVQNFDTAANTPDFPVEWTSMLVYGLAKELAYDYGDPVLAQALAQEFEREKAIMIQQNTEHGNVILVPFGASTNYVGGKDYY
jgi:hypothetical protein